MTRAGAAIGSALFFLLAPGTMAGLIPWAITQWRIGPAFFGFEPLRWLGGAFILAGLWAIIDCFARFAFEGRGTPAPIAAPKTLVVSGLYRHVRNPMYVALLTLIAGQGLLFGDAQLFVWAGVFWLATHLFVFFYEEPALGDAFGAQYDAYRAGVRRWIPGVTPWRG
ncbi:MAG: isoprenylcysteine carboxylmethyltransferase family protein [Hyphomonadaceae bacterium]